MAFELNMAFRAAALMAGIVLSAGPVGAAAAPDIPAAAPQIPAASVAEDLRLALETIERIHPDLEHSVDASRLRRRAQQIERELDQPMDQAQAWAVLARLNPVLADGHLFIGLPDWREQSARALANGERYFQFEVRVDGRERLQVISLLGGGATPHAGDFITRINGRDARDVVRELLSRAHGDTPFFRAALLSQRWWLFHAKIHGSPAWYDLEFAGGQEERIAAGRGMPVVLQRDASFDKQFQCEVTEAGAVLTVASFSWPDKARYFSFTHDCFAAIAAAGSRRLVIDIRQNGGGDDDMWRDGLLRYIADRPYRHGSRYIKRVLDPGPGEVEGQVVTGSIDSTVAPPSDEPLHFDGQVHVLVGPLTYSAAVLFANVVQDYDFATVAGTGNAARTRQSGGVQSIVLPNTGLVLSYPRFVLERPSGERKPVLLQPDLPVAEDPLNPRAAVDAVLGGRVEPDPAL